MKEQGGRVCERTWEHGKVLASESEYEAAREGLRMQNKELALHGADADGMLECLREGRRFSFGALLLKTRDPTSSFPCLFHLQCHRGPLSSGPTAGTA